MSHVSSKKASTPQRPSTITRVTSRRSTLSHQTSQSLDKTKQRRKSTNASSSSSITSRSKHPLPNKSNNTKKEPMKDSVPLSEKDKELKLKKETPEVSEDLPTIPQSPASLITWDSEDEAGLEEGDLIISPSESSLSKAPSVSEVSIISELDESDVSFVSIRLRLEGDLKSKDHQLKGLVKETSKLEKMVMKRDMEIEELKSQLRNYQKKVEVMEETVESKEVENQKLQKKTEELKLKKERSKIPHRTKKQKENQNTLQRLSMLYQAAKSDGEFSLPEELYNHVLSLDDQLGVMEKKYKEEVRAKTDITRRCKELEAYYRKTSGEIDGYKKELENQKITSHQKLSQKVIEMSRKERKLQEELRQLRSNYNLKSRRITTLEAEEKDRIELQKQINVLESQKRTNTRKITHLEKQLEDEKRMNQTNSMLKIKASSKDAGVPVHIWKRERGVLQSQVKKMISEIEAKDKTIESQKQRIIDLCDRVDLIASSLTEEPERAKRTHQSLQINGTTSTQTLVHRPLLSHAPQFETEKRAELHQFVLLEDDGEEAELTDDLFDIDITEEETGSQTISIKLYELLELEIQKLREEIDQQAILLERKDEELEVNHPYRSIHQLDENVINHLFLL